MPGVGCLKIYEAVQLRLRYCRYLLHDHSQAELFQSIAYEDVPYSVTVEKNAFDISFGFRVYKHSIFVWK